MIVADDLTISNIKYFEKYLIEKMEDLNDYFIPQLIKISKEYSEDDSD